VHRPFAALRRPDYAFTLDYWQRLPQGSSPVNPHPILQILQKSVSSTHFIPHSLAGLDATGSHECQPVMLQDGMPVFEMPSLV